MQASEVLRMIAIAAAAIAGVLTGLVLVVVLRARKEIWRVEKMRAIQRFHTEDASDCEGPQHNKNHRRASDLVGV